MFGELEDSDIYVNNQSESFEEPVEQEVNDSGEEVIIQEPPKAGDNKKLIIYIAVLVLLLAAAGGTYFYKMYTAKQADTVAEGQSTQEMGDFFYDKAKEGASASGDTAVVDVDLATSPQNGDVKTETKPEEKSAVEEKAKEEELPPVIAAKQQEMKELAKKNELAKVSKKKVVIPVTAGGRENPFVPYNVTPVVTKTPAFDIIAPPVDIPEADPLNDEMMSTKISGIMYDKFRPSAIINFDGSDHLVHKGDFVKGYRILDITKDRVVMKYGTNIYRAAVGQEVSEGLKFNDVSNLNRQFGGAYSKTPRNIIEIKGN